MQNRIKLLGQESNLTAANDVGGAKLVRVHNNTGADVKITQKTSGAVIVGDVTLTLGEVVYVEKSPTDTLEGGANVLVVAVAFR